MARPIDQWVLVTGATDGGLGEATVTTFLARMNQRGWSTDRVHVYGDATGNARDSTSGTSDWIIVRNRLAERNPVMRVPRSNPAVKETVLRVTGGSWAVVDPGSVCRMEVIVRIEFAEGIVLSLLM